MARNEACFFFFVERGALWGADGVAWGVAAYFLTRIDHRVLYLSKFASRITQEKENTAKKYDWPH